MENKLCQDSIPLLANGDSIHIINEHCGEILLVKWNQNKKLLATGGGNDNYVNIWDFSQMPRLHAEDPSLSGNLVGTSASSPKSHMPIAQLKHISKVDFSDPTQEPKRSDDNFITSIQWSNSG